MSSCSGHLLTVLVCCSFLPFVRKLPALLAELTYSTFSATGLALWLPHSDWFRKGFVAVNGPKRVLSFSMNHSLLLPFRSLVLAYLHLGHHMERALQWMKSDSKGRERWRGLASQSCFWDTGFYHISNQLHLCTSQLLHQKM